MISSFGNQIRIMNDNKDKFYYDKKLFTEIKNMNERPELKAGNIVEKENGKRGLVIQTSDNHLAIYWFDKNNGTMAYSSTEKYQLDSFKISKICTGVNLINTNRGLFQSIYMVNQGNPIWEKKQIFEVTLQEIADKFGVTT